MSLTKTYLQSVCEHVSEHAFGQEAVEQAFLLGRPPLTRDFATDVRAACINYDRCCDDYRRRCRLRDEALAPLREALARLPRQEFCTRDRCLQELATP